MTTARGEITGRKPAQTAVGLSIADTARDPITVTVREARRLTGLGNTTLYKLIGSGKLETRRVPGVARTLISYASLQSLLDQPHHAKMLPSRGRVAEAQRRPGKGAALRGSRAG